MASMPPVRWMAASCAMADEARGVREDSPNWGEDIRAYLANCDPPIRFPAAWCAAAVQAWTDKACRSYKARNPLDDVGREAYVQDYFALAKERRWLINESQADVGDLVLFSFGGERWDHIGIVIRPPGKGGVFWSCEGNTGPPDQDQRDGDGVYLKSRDAGSRYRTAFVRWDADIPLSAN